MFKIEGDTVLYRSTPVMSFAPTVWPTLRETIEDLLLNYDPDKTATEKECDEAWDDGYEQGRNEREPEISRLECEIERLKERLQEEGA